MLNNMTRKGSFLCRVKGLLSQQLGGVVAAFSP